MWWSGKGTVRSMRLWIFKKNRMKFAGMDTAFLILGRAPSRFFLQLSQRQGRLFGMGLWGTLNKNRMTSGHYPLPAWWPLNQKMARLGLLAAAKHSRQWKKHAWVGISIWCQPAAPPCLIIYQDKNCPALKCRSE